MVRAYAKGMQINCGCFGGTDIISPWTLLRDGSMLAGSLALTWVAFTGRRPAAPAGPVADANPAPDRIPA